MCYFRPQELDESSKPAQGAALIMEKFQRMIQENSSKHSESHDEGGIPGLGFELPSKMDNKGKSPGFNQVPSTFCCFATTNEKALYCIVT